jgi:hypothetical protein
VNALEERRQRAHEAGWGAACVHLIDGACELGLDDAIETATRVRITREVVEVARLAGDFDLDRLNQIDAALSAALAELGFEVEE